MLCYAMRLSARHVAGPAPSPSSERRVRLEPRYRRPSHACSAPRARYRTSARPPALPSCWCRWLGRRARAAAHAGEAGAHQGQSPLDEPDAGVTCSRPGATTFLLSETRSEILRRLGFVSRVTAVSSPDRAHVGLLRQPDFGHPHGVPLRHPGRRLPVQDRWRGRFEGVSREARPAGGGRACTERRGVPVQREAAGRDAERRRQTLSI